MNERYTPSTSDLCLMTSEDKIFASVNHVDDILITAPDLAGFEATVGDKFELKKHVNPEVYLGYELADGYDNITLSPKPNPYLLTSKLS